MYPTVVFRGEQSLAIYWETYGAGTADSLELSVRIERRSHSSPGLLRRIGYSLGLGNPLAGPAVIGWTEARPRESMLISSGPVPIYGQVLTLDLSRLDPGEYVVHVAASRPGGVPVIASRDFWFVR